MSGADSTTPNSAPEPTPEQVAGCMEEAEALLRAAAKPWHPTDRTEVIAKALTTERATVAALRAELFSAAQDAASIISERDAAEKDRDRLAAEVGELRATLPVRPEVAAFALLMEAKLRENDHKRHWRTMRPSDLYRRALEELEELRESLISHSLGGVGYDADTARITLDQYVAGKVRDVGREAADVANFAMMIADVCGALAATKSLTEGK